MSIGSTLSTFPFKFVLSWLNRAKTFMIDFDLFILVLRIGEDAIDDDDDVNFSLASC